MSGVTAATVAAYASIATAVVGAAASAYGQVQSANAQGRQADFQSKMAHRSAQIAEVNAQNAEAEGREAKRIGAENASRKRLEAQQIIAGQRAAASASGAQADVGGFLDMALDTAEKGELDAFGLNEQGVFEDYNRRLEARNIRENAQGGVMQAQMSQRAVNANSPWLGAGVGLLSSASKAANSYARMK